MVTAKTDFTAREMPIQGPRLRLRHGSRYAHGMLGEPENQFSPTYAPLSSRGAQK